MFQSQNQFYNNQPQQHANTQQGRSWNQPQQQNQFYNQGYSHSPSSNTQQSNYGQQLPFGGSATQQTSKYMPGFLSNTQGTPRQYTGAFNSPQREQRQSSTDDYNTSSNSMDRGSPPMTRGSLFGSSATPSSRNRGGNSFTRQRQGISSSADADDAPPVQSLDDFDDFPNAQQSFLAQSPPKFDDRNPSPQPPQSSLTTQEDTGPCKVIVFGFPPSALSALVEHFSAIGQINAVEPCPSPTGNWASLTFAQSWCAARCVRRSGELVNGIMVGVKWPEGIEGAPSPRPNPQQQQIQTQSMQLQQQQRGTIGTPVPILFANARAAYKPKSATPAKGWGFGLLGGNQQTTNPTANTQPNPFAPSTPQTAPAQGGVWSKVNDAIFGF